MPEFTKRWFSGNRPADDSRIRCNTLSLYLLGDGVLPSPSEMKSSVASKATSCGRFRCDIRTIDSWRFRRVRLPQNPEESDTPLDQLPALLDEMYAVVFPTESARPAYLIVHVADLLGLPSIATGLPDTSVPEVLVAVRTILDRFDTSGPGEPRGYYFQYDDRIRRKGYLAIGTHAAVMLGLSDESFATFASLLQVGQLAPTGGFTAAGLNIVNIRVAVWSANQDIHQTTDDVSNLKRSGDRSTRGQIRVSYALAFIGTALAFLPLVDHPIILAPGMIILGISGFSYAWFAEHDRSVLAARLGPLLFGLGIILLVVGFILNILVITTSLPINLP